MQHDIPLVHLDSCRWLKHNPMPEHTKTLYATPTRDDLAVCICYFSYCRYKKTLRNILTVLQDLREANIPHYVIELLYPNQTSVVPNPHKIVHAETVMFHKENLHNVLEPHIPSKYSKLLFLDADVRFTIPDWYDQTSHILDNATVMQPMGVSSWISFCKHTVAYGALQCPNQLLGLVEYHPGFAIGITRSVFHAIGGLYDRTVLGAGDSLFWDSMIRATGHPGIRSKYMTHVDYALQGDYFSEYKDRCTQNQSSIKIGCLSHNIATHMPHGARENRRYSDRSNGWNIDDYDIYKNSDGVYEWSDKKYDKLAKEYFINRKEDED
jgi:hypothetical protein